jgi:hypothetical protein
MKGKRIIKNGYANNNVEIKIKIKKYTIIK